MKRMWVGIVLLLVLLGGSLAVAWAMVSTHDPVIRALETASRAALAQDWQEAGAHVFTARKQWEQNRKYVASIADHSPMEEIDGLFAELAIFLKTREDVHFAATCAQLCKRLRAMEEAHTVSWQNLLQALPMPG